MFRLSQKSDYGLILLSSLAKHDIAGPVRTFLPTSARSQQKSKVNGNSNGELRAVVSPSSSATRKLVSIATVARKNKLSPKFLSQVALELKKAGIIASREGASGGYFLAKAANEIRILDVLTVLDGGLVKGECFEDDHECKCGAKEMWGDMKKQMEETIGRKTVADLVI